MKRCLLIFALLAGLAGQASAQGFGRMGFGTNVQYAIDHGTYTPSGSWIFAEGSTVVLPTGTVITGGTSVYVDTPIQGDGTSGDHLRLDSSSVTLLGADPGHVLRVGDSMTGPLVLTNSSYFQMDVGGTPPAHAEGRVFWDKNAHSLAFFNEEAETTQQVGQETWVRVFNDSGDTIANGAPVCFHGSSGGLPTVLLAIADSRESANVIGLATHPIEDDTTGYITVAGLAHDLNTAAFSDGDIIYLSSHVAGGFTATPPTIYGYDTIIGIVIVADASDGVIGIFPNPRGVATLYESMGNIGIATTNPGNRLDIKGSDLTSAVHIGAEDDEGAFITSFDPGQFVLSGGAEFAFAWIARHSSASLVNMNNGEIGFFTDGGLTPGGVFTPTLQMNLQRDGRLDHLGVVDYGGLTASELASASCAEHSAGSKMCRAWNLDDFDLYTSTGTAAGQWRNTRLGTGPQ